MEEVIHYSPALGRGIIFNGNKPTHLIDIRSVDSPRKITNKWTSWWINQINTWLDGSPFFTEIPLCKLSYREVHQQMVIAHRNFKNRRLN